MDIIDALDALAVRISRAVATARRFYAVRWFLRDIWWFVRRLHRLEDLHLWNQVVRLPAKPGDQWQQITTTGRRHLKLTLGPTAEDIDWLRARGIPHGPEDGIQ